MKIVAPFHSLFDRVSHPARTYNSIPVVTPTHETRSNNSFDEKLLDLPPEQLTPRVLLADSIDKLRYDRGDTSSEQREAIRKIVCDDAENLAAHIVPETVARALHLDVMGHDGAILDDTWDNETHEPLPPTIRDLMLLAQAYDVTDDPKIADALRYILDSHPPALSEEFGLAYKQAVDHGTRIMDEYRALAEMRDTRIGRPQTPEQVQWIIDMRNATPPQHRPPSDDTMEHTRFIN